MIAALLAAGVPEPYVNVRIPTIAGALEPDLRWEAPRLILECDAPGHDRPANVAGDRATTTAYTAAGYEVLRCRRSGIPHIVREITQRTGAVRE